MSKNLQLIKTAKFEGVKFDCYQDSNKEFWGTREQIGAMLGYENPRVSIANIHNRNKERLDKFSSVIKLITEAGERKTTIYNFKGLLEICRCSNQLKANAVMDFLWEMADEVRRNGMYITPSKVEDILNNPDYFINILQNYKAEREKRLKLEAQAQEDKPKVLFADSVAASSTSILVGDLAKLICQNGVSIGQNRLFSWLRDEGWLISRKGGSYNMPTQKGMDAEFFEIKERTVNNPDGSIRVTKTPKVTGKGQMYFINSFLGERAVVA